jgi:hypothetical protein
MRRHATARSPGRGHRSRLSGTGVASSAGPAHGNVVAVIPGLERPGLEWRLQRLAVVPQRLARVQPASAAAVGQLGPLVLPSAFRDRIRRPCGASPRAFPLHRQSAEPGLGCGGRGEDGRGLQDNPAFLDPVIATNDFVLPAILRARRPGPLVCRWSLNGRHGSYGYEEAKGSYEPFDRLVDPDPATRKALARVIAGRPAPGFPVYLRSTTRPRVRHRSPDCARAGDGRTANVFTVTNRLT